MTCLKIAAIASLMAVLCSQAFAVETQRRAAASRRDLATCMSKQMATSKTLSYNEAARVCKEQIRGQTNDSASAATPVKSAAAT